jgi:hypothetical protein
MLDAAKITSDQVLKTVLLTSYIIIIFNQEVGDRTFGTILNIWFTVKSYIITEGNVWWYIPYKPLPEQ